MKISSSSRSNPLLVTVADRPISKVHFHLKRHVNTIMRLTIGKILQVRRGISNGQESPDPGCEFYGDETWSRDYRELSILQKELYHTVYLCWVCADLALLATPSDETCAFDFTVTNNIDVNDIAFSVKATDIEQYQLSLFSLRNIYNEMYIMCSDESLEHGDLFNTNEDVVKRAHIRHVINKYLPLIYQTLIYRKQLLNLTFKCDRSLTAYQNSRGLLIDAIGHLIPKYVTKYLHNEAFAPFYTECLSIATEALQLNHDLINQRVHALTTGSHQSNHTMPYEGAIVAYYSGDSTQGRLLKMRERRCDLQIRILKSIIQATFSDNVCATQYKVLEWMKQAINSYKDLGDRFEKMMNQTIQGDSDLIKGTFMLQEVMSSVYAYISESLVRHIKTLLANDCGLLIIYPSQDEWEVANTIKHVELVTTMEKLLEEWIACTSSSFNGKTILQDWHCRCIRMEVLVAYLGLLTSLWDVDTFYHRGKLVVSMDVPDNYIMGQPMRMVFCVGDELVSDKAIYMFTHHINKYKKELEHIYQSFIECHDAIEQMVSSLNENCMFHYLKAYVDWLEIGLIVILIKEEMMRCMKNAKLDTNESMSILNTLFKECSMQTRADNYSTLFKALDVNKTMEESSTSSTFIIYLQSSMTENQINVYNSIPAVDVHNVDTMLRKFVKEWQSSCQTRLQ